jgi:hypothetical protein
MVLLRRTLAFAAYAAIGLLSADPRQIATVLSAPGEVRQKLERSHNPSPEMTDFFLGVRERTNRGDTITILLPPMPWDSYTYPYYRASYLLAGRTVLPMITEKGEIRKLEIARANYLAIYGAPYEGAGVIWRHGRGTLVRRR